MKARQLIPAIALLVLAWATLAHAQQTAEELYQAGLYEEEVQGDLARAIDIYGRIVGEYPNNRPVAARALMHIGLCHEKLGSREAQRAYERLVRDYADQTEVATQARTRLAELRRPLEEAEASAIVTRRVWAGPFGRPVDFSGGPTPDGRQLAYVEWETGNVAVRDLVTGESRRLTDDGYVTGYPYSILVSPDGGSLAYAWALTDSTAGSGSELRVVGMDGSGQRTLLSRDLVYPGSWSNDGRYIAATLASPDDTTTDVVRVSVEDGSLQRLKTFAHPGGLVIPSLSHSPDDRFLAVDLPVPADSDHLDISLFATDGGGSTPLVDHPADDRLIGWLPSTNDVLFISDRSGERDIWAVPVADGKARGEPRPVRRGIGEVGAMGFTGDGSLFYSVYTLQYTISIAPFDEDVGRISVDAAEPLLARGSNLTPAWSPNGEYLIYARRVPSLPGGGFGMKAFQGELWLRDVTNGEERALRRQLIAATRWFPDGRSILVVGMDKERSFQEGWDEVPAALYRVDVASGEAADLMEFPPDPDWWFGINAIPTAEGDGVIYIHDGRLVRRDITSGREVPLFEHPDLATSVLALSPDGEDLVFGVADSTVDARRPQWRLQQGGRLMIMSSRGGAARELVGIEVPCKVEDVGWTSDGRSVLYLQRDEGGTALYRVSRAGGDPERAWATERRIMGLALSPDGRRVAYYTQENEAEIWVMENLVAALSER